MLGDDKIQGVCQEIESRFKELTAAEVTAEADELRGVRGDVLYHYTSADGLLGIIQTREIWATNVLYLNDSSELSDGAESLTSELDSTPLSAWADDDFASMALSSYSKDAPVDHFVVSFCENGNLLSQWRGYGASSTGYSIGFRASALFSAANRTENNSPGECAFRKVKYGPHQKREMMRKRIAIVNEILKPLAGELEPTDDKEQDRKDLLLNRIAASFHPTLTLMKNDAFQEEKEWRLVRTLPRPDDSMLDGRVKVRSIRGKLAPYIPVSWPATTVLGLQAVKEIYCGPSASAELEEKAVRDLLSGQDCCRTRVIPSGIPLRA